MIRRLHRTGATLAVTLGLAMSASAALAQTQPAAQPQQTPATAPATSTDTGPTPSDAELKNFAHAAVEVQGIRESLQPKLAAAKTANDRTQMKADAEKKMESAVRSNHLSLNRYVQIAKVVQTDGALRAKVQQYMPPAASKS